MADYKTPSQIVLALMDEFLEKGYTLTLDNYYTSPEIAEALLSLNTDCYGTLRKKEGLPLDFWKWAPTKGDDPIVQFSGDIMVLRWNDVTKTKTTKIVSMLSTVHLGKLMNSNKKDRKTNTVIQKSDVIVDYNKTMGGVDLLSRVLIPYSSHQRGVKWYRKMAELLLDISVYNSYITWRKLNPLKKYDHLRLRKELITNLVTFHYYGTQSNRVGPKNSNPFRLRLV